MRLYQRIFVRLRQTDGVHVLLRLHLFFARLSTRFVVNYQELVRSLEAETRDERHNLEHEISHQPARCSLKPVQRRQHDASASSCYHQLEEVWDWTGFPALWPVLRVYEHFSSIWMIYSFTRTLLLDQLAQLIDMFSSPWFGIRGNCFLMGRLVSHAGIRDSYNVVFPIVHIIWRALHIVVNRHFKLTMIDFMLHSDADVERLDGQCRREYSRDGARRRGPSTRPSEVTMLRPVINQNARQASDEERQRVDQMEPVASLDERILRHAMCYRVYYGNQVYFRLRPNRSQAARALLKDRIVHTFIMSSCLMMFCVVFLAPIITLEVLTDRRYLATNPGCYPELEERQAREGLPFLSISLYRHHLIASIVEIIENVTIWLDNGSAMFYVPLLCHLLNYDILLYWFSLNARLELVLTKIRWRNMIRIKSNKKKTSSNNCALDTNNSPASINYFDQWLDTEIHELSYALADFFNEIGRVDKLISDVLTLALVIWFICCPVFGLEFLVVNRTQIPLLVVLTLLMSFSIFSIASHLLLELNRCCQRTYLTLCSMMAEDRTRRKARSLKLMDFFLQMHRTTYTLAQSYPYKSTTFIALMAYSVSAMIVSLSLFDVRLARPLVVSQPQQPNSTSEQILRQLGVY